MICKKCGNEFEGNFCPQCGEKAGDSVNEMNQNANIEKKEKQNVIPFCFKMWFIILIALFTGFMACLPAIVLFVIRLVKYPEHRRSAWLSLGGLIVAFIVLGALIAIMAGGSNKSENSSSAGSVTNANETDDTNKSIGTNTDNNTNKKTKTGDNNTKVDSKDAQNENKPVVDEKKQEETQGLIDDKASVDEIETEETYEAMDGEFVLDRTNEENGSYNVLMIDKENGELELRCFFTDGNEETIDGFFDEDNKLILGGESFCKLSEVNDNSCRISSASFEETLDKDSLDYYKENSEAYEIEKEQYETLYDFGESEYNYIFGDYSRPVKPAPQEMFELFSYDFTKKPDEVLSYYHMLEVGKDGYITYCCDSARSDSPYFKLISTNQGVNLNVLTETGFCDFMEKKDENVGKTVSFRGVIDSVDGDKLKVYVDSDCYKLSGYEPFNDLFMKTECVVYKEKLTELKVGSRYDKGGWVGQDHQAYITVDYLGEKNFIIKNMYAFGDDELEIIYVDLPY